MNLYVINEKFRALLAQADEYAEQHGGNIDDIMLDQLVNASEKLNEAREAALLMAKEQQIFADGVSAEIARLKIEVSNAKNRSESLIRLAVECGAEACKTERYELKATSGESVVVHDSLQIPEQYLRIKREADKDSIKKAIKAGEEVPGCHISKSSNWKLK